MKIRIDTQQVYEAGRRFTCESQQIMTMAQILDHAIQNLDLWAWDGRSRARAEPLLAQVRFSASFSPGE